jgi:hypothetical protein
VNAILTVVSTSRQSPLDVSEKYQLELEVSILRVPLAKVSRLLCAKLFHYSSEVSQIDNARVGKFAGYVGPRPECHGR